MDSDVYFGTNFSSYSGRGVWSIYILCLWLLQAGHTKFRVTVPLRIQLLGIFAHGKRLDLSYNPGSAAQERV